MARHLDVLRDGLAGFGAATRSGAFINEFGWDKKNAQLSLIKRHLEAWQEEIKMACKVEEAEKKRQRTHAEAWQNQSRQIFETIEDKLLTAVNKELLKGWKDRTDHKAKVKQFQHDCEVRHIGAHLTQNRQMQETVSMSMMNPAASVMAPCGSLVGSVVPQCAGSMVPPMGMAPVQPCAPSASIVPTVCSAAQMPVAPPPPPHMPHASFVGGAHLGAPPTSYF